MTTRFEHRRSHSALASLLSIVLVLATYGVGCRDDTPLEQIRSMHANKQFADSVEPLRELVSQNPDDPELNYLYGIALLRTGSPDMAIWSIRKAAESPEWAQRAGLALGNAAVSSQEWDNAVAIANTLLDKNPDDAEALLIRANAQLEQRADYESVLADFERVIELRPDDFSALVSRVATLIALGRIEDAAEGIADLEESMGSGGVSQARRSQICTIRAMFAGERDLHDEAKTLFETCLSSFPRSSTVTEQYVQYLDDQRRPDEANEVLRQSLETAPNDSWLRLSLARRLDTAKRFDESEAGLRAGITLPNRRAASDSWAGLADHYVAMQDLDSAAEAFEQSLDLVAEPTAFQTLSLADILARAGRNERALDVSKQLDNDAFRGLIEARVHLNMDEPAKALERLDEVLPLWPNNPGARYWAARAAEQLGDFGRAIEEYRQSIRSAPGFSDAELRLGRLHEAEGAIDDAWSAISRYLDDHPNNPEMAALSMRLATREGKPARLRNVISELSGRAVWGAAVAERADLLAEAGNLQDAIDTIREGSALDLTRPRNADALRALVRHLVTLGQAEEALAAAGSALTAAPDHPAFSEIQATALAATGRGEEARAEFERALELDPTNARALVGLGRILAEAGELDAGLDAFERASAIDAGLDESYESAAQLLIAAGRASEAEARWAALLKEHPYHVDAAIALARARLARGDGGERTLELARRAVRFRGGPAAGRLLADVHSARGDEARAKEILERIEADAAQS